MKTSISSTEHVLTFTKNIHRYVNSIQIVNGDVEKPLATLKLSDMQNALAQSLGYRHLHELNKSLSPVGLSSWAAYPQEVVFSVKTDFARRLIKLIGLDCEQTEKLLRTLVAGALHREGARWAFVDPADSDIKMEMAYSLEPAQRSSDGTVINLTGESGKLINETLLAIMQVNYDALCVEKTRLEEENLAAKRRLAKTFIHDMRPDEPVTNDEVSWWISTRLKPKDSFSDKLIGDFLVVLNTMIAEQSEPVH